jgi:hypothetical protein
MAKSRIPTSQNKTLVLSVLLFCTAGLCSACTKPLARGWTPFQVAVFNPLQVFVEEDGVKGARVSAGYGQNADISGIDVGFVGVSGTMTGLQINAGYNGPENLDGLQISSLNQVGDRVRGVQLGGVISYAEEAVGLQIAGLHSRAESMTGVQIAGMVNEAEELTGVQIGFVNCIWSKPFPFKCIPGMNFGFGGGDEDDSED